MAYCVNGCWTVSNRIGIGTETPSTALHIVGAHTSGLGIINAISSDSSILNLDSATADARVRLKYQGNERWFAGMSDTCFAYHIQNGNNGCIGLAVSYATGYVGVGTCNPQARLEVNDTSNFASTIFNARSDGGYLIFQGCGTTKAYLQWGLQIGGSANGKYLLLTNDESCGNIALQTRRADGTVNSCALVVACTGNVGIGTSVPIGLLEVRGLNRCISNDGLLQVNSSNSVAIDLGGSLTFGGTYVSTSVTEFAQISGRKESATSGEYGGYLDLATRPHLGLNTSRIRITSTGNVGVGTTCPATKLHVYGSHVGGRGILELQSADDALIAIRKSSGASGMRFQDFNGTDRWFVGEFNDCNIHIMDCFTSAKSRLTITRPGNIGINTCNPETTLHMTADSPYVFMDDTSTASNRKRIKLVAGDVGVIQSFSIAFSCTNNTCQVDAMFITENASVGINTACPGAYKLNVNGAFYAAGSSCEYKTQICQYNTDSCMFMKLTPVTYQYKNEYCHLGKELKSGTQIGLIAEDTAEVFPELAILKEEDNEKIVRNVDYEKLSIILLSEVQKLRKEVDNLKNNK